MPVYDIVHNYIPAEDIDVTENYEYDWYFQYIYTSIYKF